MYQVRSEEIEKDCLHIHVSQSREQKTPHPGSVGVRMRRRRDCLLASAIFRNYVTQYGMATQGRRHEYVDQKTPSNSSKIPHLIVTSSAIHIDTSVIRT